MTAAVLAGLVVVWESRPDLTGLFSVPARALSPAWLLRADQSVVSFRGAGRARLLDDLTTWATSGSPLAVRLIAARGGQGKTRLAEEVIGQVRRRRMVAGIVDRSATPQDLHELRRLRRGVLLVVDYAETRLAQIDDLLAAVADNPRRVRVLLLARGAGEWRTDPPQGSSRLGVIATCPVDHLDPVEPHQRGREEAWRDAVTALANRLGDLPGHQDVDWSRLAAELTPPSDLAASRYEPVLEIHMHALASLLRAGRHLPGANGGAAEDVLLSHEQLYWVNTAHARGLTLTPHTLRACVTIATVFGADDQTSALAVISPLYGVADLQDDQLRVVQWLATVYPGPYWGPLQPDLLGEHLTASSLASQPDLLNQHASYANDHQWAQAFTVLTRAASTHPELDQSIHSLVRDHLGPAAPAAIAIAVQSTRPQPLIHALHQLLPTADQSVLATITNAIPQQTLVLRELAAAAAELGTTALRDQQPDVPNLPDLAGSLNNLSIRLGELGRREEGLAAIQEATTVYRQLAADRPDAFLPDLAMSLNNLSVDLGELGRREEGLAAIQEATTIRRQLAADRPDAFLPNLATSLNNLSIRLGELGRREEGLAASQEATTIQRQLAADRPDAFLPDLATSLNNLSNGLGELGRPEEGLAAIQEATTVYRQLAADRPDAFLPDLAMSLNNLSNRLGELGRREEGLAAIQEATTIQRQLAADRPDAFLPNLATSLNNLSNRLGELGRREEGLAASQEATTIRRQLAADRPDASLPNLATSLNNLSIRLGELGRREEGLAASQEATTIRRQLAADRPDASLPDLATSLNNLSIRLGELGRREEGLAASQEATTVYRQLAADRPDAFLPDLAMSLNNLSVDLGELGRREEGLAAIQEATTIRRQLAADRPDAFLPNLATSLNNLSTRLSELGRREEAQQAADEAANIRLRLRKHSGPVRF